ALSQEKKCSLAKHTKLNMCRVSPRDMSYQEIRGGHGKKGRIREDRDLTGFLHNAED
ncbi:unnamed protein product, partial [Staurois parvus]